MNDFNMPYENENKVYNRDNKGGPVSPLIYKPFPFEAGAVANNELLIPLFTPHTWKMFNPTEEEAARYGMMNSGLVSLSEASPLYTFYFMLPVHRVQNFSSSQGNLKFAQVLCPVEMNKYMTEGMQRGPMFKQPRCAFCEEVSRQWDIENARWDEIEASEGISKKKLSREGYWDRIDNDPVLSKARKAINKLKVQNRYVVGVFDHAKFTGQRALDEGEDAARHQLLLAPKSIRDKLINLFNADLRFFEPTPEGQWPVLTLVKDTSACKAGSMLLTKYDVMFVSKYHPYDEAWNNYLRDYNAMADPSELVQLVTYEDGRFYVEQERESRSYNAQPSAPASTPPVGTPPVGVNPVGPAPVAANPVAPPPVAAPPVATPVAAPPAGAPPAISPPPVAPPAAAPPAAVPPAAAPPAGPPIPAQPPAPAPTQTTTPGGPIPVVSPGGAPPAGAPPVAAPPGAAPTGPTPMGAPPAAAPPAGAPPVAQPPVGAPPDRTPPVGEDPPGRRRNW